MYIYIKLSLYYNLAVQVVLALDEMAGKGPAPLWGTA